MTDNAPQSRILVMTDRDDADGTVWRAVVLYADGSLAIQGYDTGPAVQRTFGTDEYEFVRELSTAETDQLGVLLDISGDADLLAVIEERFAGTSDLERFLAQHGPPGTLTAWNR